LLCGQGRFGSRANGSKDAGSPRYISVGINLSLVNTIYPYEDLDLLKYIYEDGNKAEPAYFIPIIPMVILESGRAPSEGWADVL
jgi:DNA topoisomerase-2